MSKSSPKSPKWGKESMKKSAPEIPALKMKLKMLANTDPYPNYVDLHGMDPSWHKYAHPSFRSQVDRIRRAMGKFESVYKAVFYINYCQSSQLLTNNFASKAKGAVSSDEDDVLPDPTGGAAGAGRSDHVEDEDDDDEESWVDAVGGDSTSKNERSDDEVDLSRPARHSQISSHTSPFPSPRLSFSAGSAKMSSIKKVSILKTSLPKSSPVPWSNYGVVVFDFFMSEHGKIEGDGRSFFIFLEVATSSGALEHGNHPTVILNHDTNSIEISIQSKTYKDFFYGSDGMVSRRHVMYSDELIQARNVAIAELTKNSTAIPTQVMTIPLPKKCTRVIKVDIPNESYEIKPAGATPAKNGRFAKMNIYVEMDFKEFTKPSITEIDDVESPPVAGYPPPANHLPTPPRYPAFPEQPGGSGQPGGAAGNHHHQHRQHQAPIFTSPQPGYVRSAPSPYQQQGDVNPGYAQRAPEPSSDGMSMSQTSSETSRARRNATFDRNLDQALHACQEQFHQRNLQNEQEMAHNYNKNYSSTMVGMQEENKKLYNELVSLRTIVQSNTNILNQTAGMKTTGIIDDFEYGGGDNTVSSADNL